jgi:hypothetical protein
MRGYYLVNLTESETTGRSYAGGLRFRVGRADIGVQTAG